MDDQCTFGARVTSIVGACDQYKNELTSTVTLFISSIATFGGSGEIYSISVTIPVFFSTRFVTLEQMRRESHLG